MESFSAASNAMELFPELDEDQFYEEDEFFRLFPEVHAEIYGADRSYLHDEDEREEHPVTPEQAALHAEQQPCVQDEPDSDFETMDFDGYASTDGYDSSTTAEDSEIERDHELSDTESDASDVEEGCLEVREPQITRRATAMDIYHVQGSWYYRAPGIPAPTRAELYQRFPHLSRSAINRICRMPLVTELQNTLENRRTGRHRTLSTPEVNRIVAAINGNAEYRRMPYVELCEILDIDASPRTVRRRLNERGYHRRVARKAPFLTEVQRQQRKAWAIAHIRWAIAQWCTVIWQDESQCQNGGIPRQYVTRRAGEEYLEECLQPRHRRPLKAVHISGLICGRHKSNLLFIPKGSGLRGGMTGADFIEHVCPQIYGFYEELRALYPGRRFILMLDNSPIHTTKIVKAWFAERGVVLMKWPPNSPDLNPIEHCWAYMKRGLRRRGSETGTQELYEAVVLDEWNRITVATLMNFMKSMHKRCKRVLFRRGGHSGY